MREKDIVLDGHLLLLVYDTYQSYIQSIDVYFPYNMAFFC